MEIQSLCTHANDWTGKKELLQRDESSTLSCWASLGASFLLMNSSRASGASVLGCRPGAPGELSRWAGI